MNSQLTLHLVSFGLINLAIILVGYLFIKYKMILTGWLTLVISILIVHLLFIHEHPILRMFAIIATTFTGMKMIAVTEGYRNKPLALSFKQWVVYAVG